MNNRLYGNLIFELSKPGRRGYSLPKNEFGHHEVPTEMRRSEDAKLPECDELTVVRHYTNLSANNFGNLRIHARAHCKCTTTCRRLSLQ